MRGSLGRGDGKKVILIILDILFGLYFLNAKLSFISSFNSVSSFNDLIIFIGGILLLLNFLYLLIFSRRIRVV